jgi:phage baseplate assembly protein gpV
VLADITGSLTATVAAQATLTSPIINLNGTVNVNGPLNLAGPLSATPGPGGGGATLQGNFQIDGSVSLAGGDITADGVSLKSHTHPGDSGGNTGPPN